MKFHAIWLLILLSGWPTICGAQNRPSPPTGPAELYFLSVGLGEYAIDTANSDLPEADISARLVAKALIDAGAKYGIVLTSQTNEARFGHVVTRRDITNALYNLKAKIRSDATQTPRIVVYMMGHGYGDPVANILFLAPGDLAIDPSKLSQSRVRNLVHNTIWNGDIISALVNFRTHLSMRHFDDFLPSQLMSDSDNVIQSRLRVFRRSRELYQIHNQRQANGEYAPDGNPPVPYLLLFENCFGTIRQDLTLDPGRFSAILNQTIASIQNEGRVYYSAPPGSLAQPVEPPPWVNSSTAIGPLAARLIDTLIHLQPGASFAQVAERIQMGQPIPSLPNWTPFSHSGQLLEDVAGVQFLPPNSKPTGTLEVRFGSGI